MAAGRSLIQPLCLWGLIRFFSRRMFGRRTSLEADLRQHEAEDAERERDRAELYGEESVPSPAASSVSTPSTANPKKRKAAGDVERRAPIFQHWTHDIVKKKYCCKYCKKVYSDSNASTPLTSHTMEFHLDVIEGKNGKERVPDWCRKKADTGDGNDTPSISRKAQKDIDDKLKRLIVDCSLPFSMVDYKEFIVFAKALNPSYVVPSRNTLKSWLFDDFEKYKEKIKKELAAAPGRISLTMDPWTSVAQEGYMAITAHWITKEFELRRVLLDFVDLPAEHSAENLKNSVLKVLREYGIAHKTLGYTMDGASNMTAFFRDLLPELRMERESHGVKTDVSEFRIRCICHVVNTVCQVGVVDENNLIGRVRDLIQVVKRPKAKKIFRSLLSEEKKKKVNLPLDCATRWNSTLLMLERAHEMRHDLKKYFTLHGTTETKKGLLLEKEWEDVKQLIEFLTPMHQITLDCSVAIEPTFHVGKLCLTRLALHLRQTQEIPDAVDMVKKTAKAMDEKLKLVSPDSWQQEVVKVAQLLDPCIKTSLVPDTAGKLEASDLLKKFSGYYKSYDDGVPKTPPVTSLSSSSIRSGFLKLLNKNATVDQSEVDKYLGSAVELDCKPLQWWKERREVYPTLSRLVLDVFAVCASSAESERWFSQSGRLITKSRCSLGTNSIQVSMCLKSWYNHVFVISDVLDLTEG